MLMRHAFYLVFSWNSGSINYRLLLWLCRRGQPVVHVMVSPPMYSSANLPVSFPATRKNYANVPTFRNSPQRSTRLNWIVTYKSLRLVDWCTGSISAGICYLPRVACVLRVMLRNVSGPDNMSTAGYRNSTLGVRSFFMNRKMLALRRAEKYMLHHSDKSSLNRWLRKRRDVKITRNNKPSW